MSEEAWRTLIRRYAVGREICNCGCAYYAPIGSTYYTLDGEKKIRETRACEYGCQHNQYAVKNDIAKAVLAELKLLEEP